MFKFHASPLIAALLWPAAAAAVDPFTIQDIRVEGAQRIEAGTVFNYLPFKVGDHFDDSEATQAVKALYATGFFKDVQLEAQGSVVVVQLLERPAIAEISINGAKSFKDQDLKKALQGFGISESRVFDQAILDRALQELKLQYYSKGKYGVEIKSTVTPLERNRVLVRLNIEEGVIAKIKQINIVGNHTFPEKTLLDELSSSVQNYLSWYSKNDQYSKQKLEGDLESLRSFYQDRGYQEFQIDSKQVMISPDKRDIYITIHITEGQKYTIGDVSVAGTLIVAAEELKQLIQLKSNDTFSLKLLAESTQAIIRRLESEGYAFANISPVPQLDKANHRVSYVFYIDPGRRFFVRRIQIAGNTVTRDVVIRREIRQMEQAWFNGDLVRRSRTRINQLGYFSDVSFETPRVPGTIDQVDLNYNVVESPTQGGVNLGVGYGGDGMTFQASLTRPNIFGSGNYFAAHIDASKAVRSLNLNFIDPYFTVDGVSRSYNLYFRRIRPEKIKEGKYSNDNIGVSIGFGLPISEEESINLSLGVDETRIQSKPVTGSPVANDFIRRYGSRSLSFPVIASWTRNTLDDILAPNEGTYQVASLEVGAPGSRIPYYKANYQHQRYFPFSQASSLMLRGQLGYGGAFGGNELPFYRNYYAGGISSVRGYEEGALGPRDSTDSSIGGTKLFLLSSEFFFPFPGMKKERTLRLSAFVDAGNVFGPGDKSGLGSSHFKLKDLRTSAGVAFSWVSPLGPLKFSLSRPLNAKSGDPRESFQVLFGLSQ